MRETTRKIWKEFCGRYSEMEKVNIEGAYYVLLNSARAGRKILICGNGGSASDSVHIVGELMKGFNKRRPLTAEEKMSFSMVPDGTVLADRLQRAIPAISLASQTALITAIGNDVDFSMIFAQQVYAYGVEGDCLIAMSTSGNSLNVRNAALVARVKHMKIIGITGEQESTLGSLSDICIRLPASRTFEVQEYTLPLYHVLCAMLEEELFGAEEP